MLLSSNSSNSCSNSKGLSSNNSHIEAAFVVELPQSSQKLAKRKVVCLRSQITLLLVYLHYPSDL